MKDKICLITGANSGIGKITARALARKGAHIIMLCRNGEKAEKAKEEIVKATKNEAIEIFLADLAHQEQIHRVAEEIKQKHAKIDVLINNAGFIAKSYREITQDGLEITFAVNHMAYFMLTNLLIKPIKASPRGRIINVSSEAHRYASLDWNNLQLQRGYSNLKAYGISKLCNILFTRELAKRLDDSYVTTNCLHPGGVATNFALESEGFMKYIFQFARPFLLSPEQGADTSIFLASNPEVGDITGEYFIKRHVRLPAREARDGLKAKRLWEISAELAKMENMVL